MTGHKFTDEEVIKLVGVYVERMCNKCNVKDLRHCCTSCFIGVLPQAIEIINRQKAEIEELREIIFTDRTEAIKKLKAEAIKEYLAKVLEKKDTASHYEPGAEVVTVEVLEHYARQFTEGSGE